MSDAIQLQVVIDSLRAELAALRALREADIAALSFGRNAALEREKRARELLAEVQGWAEYYGSDLENRIRAFLARGEGEP